MNINDLKGAVKSDGSLRAGEVAFGGKAWIDPADWKFPPRIKDKQRKRETVNQKSKKIIRKLRSCLIVEFQNKQNRVPPPEKEEIEFLKFAKKTVDEIPDDEFLDKLFGKIKLPIGPRLLFPKESE